MNSTFRKQLEKLIGRKPTEAEVREAFERVSRINRLLDEIRLNRNGMRKTPAEKPDETS